MVSGAGVIGQLVAQLARANGAEHVVVVDPLLTETIRFDQAPEAYARLDADCRAALKIGLNYGTGA